MGESLVTAVVVNYNSGVNLDICLQNLLADTESLSRVIVYDNASSDGSWEAANRTGDDRVSLV